MLYKSKETDEKKANNLREIQNPHRVREYPRYQKVKGSEIRSEKAKNSGNKRNTEFIKETSQKNMKRKEVSDSREREDPFKEAKN